MLQGAATGLLYSIKTTHLTQSAPKCKSSVTFFAGLLIWHTLSSFLSGEAAANYGTTVSSRVNSLPETSHLCPVLMDDEAQSWARSEGDLWIALARHLCGLLALCLRSWKPNPFCRSVMGSICILLYILLPFLTSWKMQAVWVRPSQRLFFCFLLRSFAFLGIVI